METVDEITPVYESAATVNAAATAIVTAQSHRQPIAELSGGQMRPVYNSVATVNAAAAAIVTAQSRRQPPAELRRKWTGWLKIYFCFGSQKNGRRVNHAALVPEPTLQWTAASAAAEISNHPPPPSSPASVTSPGFGTPPLSPLSPIISPSPTRTPSIFAIGPYAYETELVSPPLLSASTTEPSTGTFTPPESAHLTTPSSPEVPYAMFLASINDGKNGETDDLQSYLNYQDSPIGFQIPLNSGCSGTSSPFPDPEMFASTFYKFPSLLAHEPPMTTLDGEGGATHNLIPPYMHNGGSLLDGHNRAAVPGADFTARLQPNDQAMQQKASFELSVDEVIRGLKKKTTAFGDASTASFRFAPSSSSGDHKKDSEDTRAELHIDNSFHDMTEKAKSSLSLRLAKEFNFDIGDATNVEPSVGSDWWPNEKIAGISEKPDES